MTLGDVPKTKCFKFFWIFLDGQEMSIWWKSFANKFLITRIGKFFVFLLRILLIKLRICIFLSFSRFRVTWLENWVRKNLPKDLEFKILFFFLVLESTWSIELKNMLEVKILWPWSKLRSISTMSGQNDHFAKNDLKWSCDLSFSRQEATYCKNIISAKKWSWGLLGP